MNTTEIKKALYKQKPTAIRTNYQGEYVHYVTQLEDASIIQFEIPNQEATFGNAFPLNFFITLNIFSCLIWRLASYSIIGA